MKEKALSSLSQPHLWMLITYDNQRIILDDTEKNAIYNCILRNDKYIIIHGEIIPLHIIPTIRKLSSWFQNENERLRIKNKRLCRKCLSITEMGSGCDCREINQNKEIIMFKK